jgi:hypothetical protein
MEQTESWSMPNIRFVGAVALLVVGAISFYFAALAFGACSGGQTLVLSGVGILLIGSAVSLVGLPRTGLVVFGLGAAVLIAGLVISHGAACSVP